MWIDSKAILLSLVCESDIWGDSTAISMSKKYVHISFIKKYVKIALWRMLLAFTVAGICFRIADRSQRKRKLRWIRPINPGKAHLNSASECSVEFPLILKIVFIIKTRNLVFYTWNSDQLHCIKWQFEIKQVKTDSNHYGKSSLH